MTSGMKKGRVARLWATFRKSILFIPTIMTGAAVALFAVTSTLDPFLWERATGPSASLRGGPLDFLVFGGSAEAANSVLSTVAGTWATIAGVVYSITLVTVQLSATKYSAQVIPTFERDRFNQITLGAFAGTVVYSLLVLKTVRHPGSDGAGAFVPTLGVNLSLLFAVVTLFMFIWFIGNLTSYIRPTKFVDGVAATGVGALDVLRRPTREEGFEPADVGPPDESGTPVRAETRGHLDHVDWSRIRRVLEARAVAGDDPLPTRITVDVTIGAVVDEGDALLHVSGPAAEDRTLHDALRDALPMSELRDIYEDPVYAVQSLGDVAITALSGGSTDVGVAKSAVGALYRIAAADLSKPPVREGFRIELPTAEVEVARVVDVPYSSCFLEIKRILDKGVSAGYWDLAEVVVDGISRVTTPAVEAEDPNAWRDTARWVRVIISRALAVDDEASKARTVASVAKAIRSLQRAGHHEAAWDVARALRDAPEGSALATEMDVALEEALRE